MPARINAFAGVELFHHIRRRVAHTDVGYVYELTRLRLQRVARVDFREAILANDLPICASGYYLSFELGTLEGTTEYIDDTP